MTDFWLFIIYFEWKSELFALFCVFDRFFEAFDSVYWKEYKEEKNRNN